MTPAPASSSPRAAYGEGIKWIVGLSAAAIAGAFLHVHELSQQSSLIRWLSAFAVGLFVLSVLFALNYLLLLNMVDVHKLEINEADKKLKDNILSQEELDQCKKRRDHHQKRLTSSDRYRGFWHGAHLVTSCLAALLVLVILFAAIRTGHGFGQDDHGHDSARHHQPHSCPDRTPAPATVQPRYVITYSAPHMVGNRKLTHTFLVNQQTGEVWQMTCQKNGVVAFRKVEKF